MVFNIEPNSQNFADQTRTYSSVTLQNTHEPY